MGADAIGLGLGRECSPVLIGRFIAHFVTIDFQAVFDNLSL